MLKKALILAALSTAAVAQPTTWSVDENYAPKGCTFNSAGVPTNRPCTTNYVNPLMPIFTSRYGWGGGPLSYKIPHPNGLVSLTLCLEEPRNPATQPTRTFDIRVGRLAPVRVDPYRAVGTGKVQELNLLTTVVDGFIYIDTVAVAGNSMISCIIKNPINTAAQLPTVPTVAVWKKCESGLQPAPPGSLYEFWSCEGLQYLAIWPKDNGGMPVILYGFPFFPGPVDPTNSAMWKDVN